MNLKSYVNFMQENTYKIKITNYWRNIEKKIFFSFIILFVLGLFFSFSSTSSLAGERLNKDYYFFFSKHLIFTFIAFIIMILISVIDTPLLKKFIIPSFVASFILLVLVPLIGVEVKGSKRWLDFYFLRLQPIEVLKPFFILASVKILTTEKFQNPQIKYFYSFLLLLLVITLLINQPDLGQSILLVLCWLAIVFISGVSLLFIFCFISIFIITMSSLLFFMPEKFGYIINRLITFLDPSKGDAFQSSSALNSIKLGGLKGQGMGEGILKDRVPEAHTDYIISVISEEFGVIAIMLILVLFLVFIFSILKKVSKEKDNRVKLILVGSASLITLQAMIHIGVNIRLFPTTGMTLPFLSYGGSSIISVSILSGIILNLTKRRI